VISGLNEPIPTLQGEWLPEDEHSDTDSMTLRAALRTSSNRAAVQLLTSVGIPEAVGYAQKLNVGTPPSVPSLALGASDVTLASLTAAYGAFANHGVVRRPILIRRVEDNEGTVLFSDEGASQQAVSDSTAYLMASMLSDVINAGTAYRARQIGFNLPAAGKTGTTNDYVDAWFVGFTTKIVTGVWIGFDQPKKIIDNGYAGELAVPIWAAFMKKATRGAKPEWLERPANVVGVNVCRISGKLPSQGCEGVLVANTNTGQLEKRSMVYTDFFVKGTQPGDTCALHQSPSFLDRLAGIFGKDSGVPVSAEPSGAPLPGAVSTSGAPTAPSSVENKEEAKKADGKEEKVEDGKKKRGFWGRLFGRGDDDKKKEEEERKKEEERRKKEEEQRKRKPGGGF
jgi:membrane carboxypeptidase/penicillin-binding protein